MKHQTIKINIAEPCHENWEKMLDEERGKFCLSCQKQVVDFSRMSNEEIINYFNVNEGKKICGRIAKHQHNTPISNYQKVVTPWFNRYVAGFFMALGFYNPSSAQTKDVPVEQHMKGEIAVKQPHIRSDKKLVINGRVLNSATNKGMKGVSITVVGSDITVTTDKNGNYTISIPARLQNENLVLSVYHSGYNSQEITGIDYNKTTVSVITKLYIEEKHIMGDMIMGKVMPSKEN
ncbi:MAG: carboxypeptidase regulatory-like domain-containing protein [Sphingobacteriaceae bacterium]|nr:carboxypeptidase regulatory-like domain-containing protein [Sphingobacteriaceae bacterium]